MITKSKSDGLNFVALDVETANQQYSSICQIGLAFVEQGKLLNSLSFLVDPKTSFSNTHIHGIDKSAVEGKPTFKDISEVIFPLIQGKRVVHHTNFDFRALLDACRKANIELPETYFYDSAKIARSLFPKYKMRGYGLKDLCRDFSVTQTQHHDAEDDAKCLALTLLNIFEEAGLDFLVWENPLITKRIMSFNSSPDKKLGGIETIILRSLNKTIAEVEKLITDNGGTVVKLPTEKTVYGIMPRTHNLEKIRNNPTKKEILFLKLLDEGQSLEAVNENNLYDFLQGTYKEMPVYQIYDEEGSSDREFPSALPSSTIKNMYTKVSGVTYRNEDGRRRQEIIAEDLYAGMDLFLERDRENAYDQNAIAVLTCDYGETVGYLSRDVAAELAPLMDNGQLITATIANITGEEDDGKTLGVNLFLTILTKEETEAAARRSAAKYQATSPASPAKPDDDFVSVPSSTPRAVPSWSPDHEGKKKKKRPGLLAWWRGLPKRTRTWIIIIGILILAALCNALTSCAPKEVIVVHTQQIPVTQIVEVTRPVEITRLVIVTATPVPPTPTPVFQKYSLDQVRETILAAGLEFADPRKMEPKDYGYAPYNAVEGRRFLIPSLCYDCGGRVFTFENAAKLTEMKRYYDTLGETSAALFSWTFARENILIQINGTLPESQALLYQQALDSLP